MNQSVNNFVKLPSYKFKWENSFNCQLTPTPFEYNYNENKFFIKKPWMMIGYNYCPPIKREDQMAVMFENTETFDRLWCHCRPDLLVMMGYELNDIPEELKGGMLLKD